MIASAVRNISILLEDPDANELSLWANKFVDKLKQLPELEDVATDQQPGGLAVSLTIDRPTASRLGIAPTTIDNTLYDAFGQRQINTMYTQLNQYHVILETQPQFQLDPNKLNKLYIQSNSAAGTTGAAASSSGNGSTSAGLECSHDFGPVHAHAKYSICPGQRSDSQHVDNNIQQGPLVCWNDNFSQPSNAVPLGAISHFEHGRPRCFPSPTKANFPLLRSLSTWPQTPRWVVRSQR